MLFSHKRFTNILGPKDSQIPLPNGIQTQQKKPYLARSKETFFSRKENLVPSFAESENFSNAQGRIREKKLKKSKSIVSYNESENMHDIQSLRQGSEVPSKIDEKGKKRNSMKSGSIDFSVSSKEILGHYQGSQEFSVKNILSIMKPNYAATLNQEQMKNISENSSSNPIAPKLIRNSISEGVRISNKSDGKLRGKNLETRHSDIERSNDINLSERNGSYITSKDLNAINISERALQYSKDIRSPSRLVHTSTDSMLYNQNLLQNVVIVNNPSAGVRASVRSTFKSLEQIEALPRVEEINRESFGQEEERSDKKGQIIDEDEEGDVEFRVGNYEENFNSEGKKQQEEEFEVVAENEDEDEEKDYRIDGSEHGESERAGKNRLYEKFNNTLTEPSEERSELSFQNVQNNNNCSQLENSNKLAFRLNENPANSQLNNQNAFFNLSLKDDIASKTISIKTASIDLSTNLNQIMERMSPKNSTKHEIFLEENKSDINANTGRRIKKPPALSEIFHSPRSSGFL
jgi:hypothetical protein